MSVDLSKVEKLIADYGSEKGVLIPLLQDIENVYGYVPTEVIEVVARELNVFPVEIYGILTFYTQFHLKPRGEHTIYVCQGTACHVMGSKDILDYLLDKLNIKEAQTTQDGMFTVERAACLGCCGMAPVVKVDEDFYGWVTIQKMDEILQSYQDKAIQ
jgi:NADH-quinone oxidoreductase subunit E